jgi:hypothetical protein
MAYFLCGNGSGGSGREAVIRGTCALLPCPPELITPCLEEDWGCGLGKLAALTRQEAEEDWIHQIQPGDVCLAMAGGDSPWLERTAKKLRRKGAVVAAWNWSCGNRPPDHATVSALRCCNAVAVRDKLSFSILEQLSLRRNVSLYADPSFLVEPICVPFPESLEGNRIVGITLHREVATERLTDSFRRLIGHILQHTDFSVALIPFGPRDEWVLRCLVSPYEQCQRIQILQRTDYRILKGYISRCALYVSTCEDALLAAWSCGVPALAVGENLAPTAIARELLGSHNGCTLSRARQPEALILAFLRLWRTEDALQQQLKRSIPACRSRAAAAADALLALSG